MIAGKRKPPNTSIITQVSEKDLDTIRSSYVAMNEGDVQGALAALHRDAVWSESRELPGADRFEGREAIEAFLDGFMEQWDVFDQHVESTLRRGARVLVNIHMNAVGSGSGVEVSAHYAHVWTLRDGLGARVDAYYDTEAALRDFEG